MTEAYLSLPRKEQTLILKNLSTNTDIKRDALLLEKDIWICWALEFLFKMPNRLPMAFKGETSLSKAFRVIDRFSEDVDITLIIMPLIAETRSQRASAKPKLKISAFSLDQW